MKNNIEQKEKQRKIKNKSDGICPYAKKCGGSDYQGIEYKKQLELKETSVKKL